MTPRLACTFAATLVSVCCPVFRSTAIAQSDPRATKIERYLAHLETNNKFLGSVAISIDGQRLVDHQVGPFAKVANVDHQSNPETQYRIGSITKMFTAVMIMQLIEEHKLSLETKLSEFFPELNHADAITIEQLMRHRSGLGSFTDDPTYRTWNTKTRTRQEMIDTIASQPILFQPNERSQYSNTNYVLLGYIVEKLSGNSYGEELKTRIVDRVGLQRTAYATPADASGNVAISFTWSNGQWTPHSQTDPGIPHGAGAIMSTASDLVLFIESLFDGKLLQATSLDAMTKLDGRMGMGMMQVPFGAKRAYSHNGGIDGFQSSLAYFPEDKVAIALLGNGFSYPMNDIMIGLLSITFKRNFELPSFDAKQVDEETLKQYEGVYAAAGIPLKITVSVKQGQLFAQATGQAEFPLTPTSDIEFKFDAAGIVIAFTESESGSGFDGLRLKQAGQNIPFKQER